MTEKQNEVYSGIIKMYNGQFGFIEYYKGDIFFHRSDLESHIQFEKGNIVSFQIIPSKKKKGEFQASEIVLKNSEKAINGFEIYNKLKLGTILWHDYRGYGVIENQNTEYFFRDNNLHNEKFSSCYEGRKCIFKPYSKSFEYKAFDIFTIPDSLFETLKTVIFEKNSFVETIKKEIYSYNNLNEISTFRVIVQLLDLLIYLKVDITEITETIYNKSTSDIKFLFWYYNFTKKFELNYIIDIIIDKYGQKLIWLGIREKRGFSWSNEYESYEPYRNHILNKILIQEEHDVVLNQLVYKLDTITSYFKEYEIITLISNLKIISDEEKEQFYNLAYIKCDDECKIKMWKTGLVKEKDINLIAENLPYTIPEFIEIFNDSTNDEKFILLSKAVKEYNYKQEELHNQEVINSFITSEFFSDKINNAKLQDCFELTWRYNPEKINAQNIISSFNSEEFIKLVSSFREKEKLVSKIEQFYIDLPTIFQLQLWLSDILGELDYIKFTQVFHQLTNEDKKLFNKKVKSLALEEQ